MTPEVIALCMFGLLLLGLFMGHPLAFVLGGTAVLGALGFSLEVLGRSLGMLGQFGHAGA